jgi:UDP-N-acetylmuramate dehydrogenase
MYRMLADLPDVEAEYCAELAAWTSFRTGGPADCILHPRTTQALQTLLALREQLGVPAVVLGGGTNVLVPDRGLRAAVIRTDLLDRITVEPPAVTAEAGAAVSRLCTSAAEAGLSGIERLYGLPGSIGGAIAGNAGCFGTETADSIMWIEYCDESGNLQRISRDEARFGYRSSRFREEGGLTILQARFLLISSGESGAMKKIHVACMQRRNERGHFRFPSAGSVFKRPELPPDHPLFGKTAGELIELSGLKGFRCGGAQIADYHANFIINPELKASSADIVDLMETAERQVFSQTGVRLSSEILVLNEEGRPYRSAVRA